jgi:four helix bundle protein
MDVAADRIPERAFDHERLEVYQLALALDGQLHSAVPRRGMGALRDQLERASVSVVANIAEGAGRVAVRDKRRFYAMARGSATEVAALLDVLRARGGISAAAHARARGQLLRVVRMLSRLCLGRRGIDTGGLV